MTIDVRIRCRRGAADALDVEWRSEAKSAMLAGHSGAGKTLLLRALCGLERPDEGRILFGEQVIFDGVAGTDLKPAARGCAYVPSEPCLAPRLSVRANLALPVRLGGRVERSRRVEAMVEEAGLKDCADAPAGTLSAGLQLRAAVARALLAKPRLVLIDEPLRGVDADLLAELRGAVDAAVNGHGARVVVCARSPESGLDLAQETVLLESGRVVRQGPGEDWLDDPGNEATVRWLGRHVVLEAEILALDPARRASRLLCQPGTGHAFEAAAPYFPGLLIGAKIRVAVRRDRVQAQGRGPGFACALAEAREGLASVQLRFENGLAAEISRREWEPFRHTKIWSVEIPAEAVRLLR